MPVAQRVTRRSEDRSTPDARELRRTAARLLAVTAVAFPFFWMGSGCSGADGFGGSGDDDGSDGGAGGAETSGTPGSGGKSGSTGGGGPSASGATSGSGQSTSSGATGTSGSATSSGSGTTSGTSSGSGSQSSASASASSSSSGGGGDGDCCVAHGGLGCSVASIEACVCSFDPYCCDTAWDGQCAGEAASDCGACGGSSSSSSASASASSGSGGMCTGWGEDCWSSPYPCCQGYFCSNANGLCMFDAGSTSTASGGGCSNPTGYGGLGCDQTFSLGCQQIGCSCCEDGSGIGHCC